MPFNKERFRDLRKSQKITTQDVSDIVGVGRAVISRYESGVISKIESDKIELLAQAVHCDPAYLMGWQDSPTCDAMMVNATEQAHVEVMRTLSLEGQEKLLEYTEDLIASGKYAKEQNSL